MPSVLADGFVARSRVAYFSMEIALHPDMHTYAGGLGVLAGDTVRSCGDLELPLVFVTLASRAGYFRQEISQAEEQIENPDPWEPASWCTPLADVRALELEGRTIWIRPWLFTCDSAQGYQVPVLLLDTDVELNALCDRHITHELYGGDQRMRLLQEAVLGIGGLAVLRATGFDIRVFHLNEGHAALLTLELLRQELQNERQPRGAADAIAEVRQRCVFTTHTPVEAGHDRFDYALLKSVLPQLAGIDELRHLAGADELNMTKLALNLSAYVNGVGRQHAETTARLFPGYRIHAISNGIHAETWAHPSFARLFTRHMPRWQREPEELMRALDLPSEEVWRCHEEAKADLIALVREGTGIDLDPEKPIIGFARRMTAYKRPLLLLEDEPRLLAIAERMPFQIVFGGKAHPRDATGKDAIRRLLEVVERAAGRIAFAYVPNYEMRAAKTMVAGCDVWLNTPLPPLEASGTSGMKAALNGVINFSVLDGWWTEAHVEGVTGWAISPADLAPARHSGALYEKLERTVLPLWYDEPERWRTLMKQSIGRIAPMFNTHRMMRRYASEAYLRCA